MTAALPLRAWAASEDLVLCRQYHAGVAIARIEVPTRTNEACISRVKDLIKDGVLTPRGTAARNRKAKPDPLTIWRRLCEAEAAPKRKPRTCLSCGRTFLSAHAGNRLCERHNGASATPWESGYRVARVRVSA